MGKRNAQTEGSEEEAMDFDHCVTKEYIAGNEAISVDVPMVKDSQNKVIQFEVTKQRGLIIRQRSLNDHCGTQRPNYRMKHNNV